jgi:hypothetical protein
LAGTLAIQLGMAAPRHAPLHLRFISADVVSGILAGGAGAGVRAPFSVSRRNEPGRLPSAAALNYIIVCFTRMTDDLTRTMSRHTLSYMLCSISELFRHYADFDPLDLLIVHAILNANVVNVMKDLELDRQFGSIHAVEPDEIKQGISRASLARFLNLPIETIRRRVARLKARSILSEEKDGLIVSEQNKFKFGNNHDLQKTNVLLLRKLLRDLKRAGINGPDDL